MGDNNVKRAPAQEEGSEPVGWQWRFKDPSNRIGPEWNPITASFDARIEDVVAAFLADPKLEARPVYASPPPLPAGNWIPPVSVESDANLAAILHYTEAFYAVAIKHRLPAVGAADAVQHVEKAARRLHTLATATTSPLPAGNADPRVREALETLAQKVHGFGHYSEAYLDPDNRDAALEAHNNAIWKARDAIREFAAALPSPQSQGLVEAAGWTAHLIWWVHQSDCARVEMLLNAGLLNSWPAYLLSQHRSAFGRAGRGRLWVAAELRSDAQPPPEEVVFQFGEAPSTIANECAGIVIRAADLSEVHGLPGFVTSFDMRLLRFRASDRSA